MSSPLSKELEAEREILRKIYDIAFPRKKKHNLDESTDEDQRRKEEEEQRKRDITRKWTKWNFSKPVSNDWEGVTVNRDGFVIKLNLSGRKLTRKYIS